MPNEYPNADAAWAFLQSLKSQHNERNPLEEALFVRLGQSSNLTAGTPIEKVASFARKELEVAIALEKELKDSQAIPQLGEFDRSIFNLRVINSWVDPNRWLYEYLLRSRQEPRIVTGVSYYAHFLNPIYLFGGVPDLIPGLTLSHEGIKCYYGLNDPFELVTQERLQRYWDMNYRSPVKRIARLDRQKVASKVLSKIPN